MTTTVRDVGDRERFTVTFTDLNGNAADPTTITFKVREPDGSTTTVATSDSPSQITNSSTGVYYYDFTYSQEGRHFFEWVGEGNLIAAVASERYARRSNVA